MKQIFFTLLFGILLSQSSVADSKTTVDEVIKSSFTGVSIIEPKQIILTNRSY